MKGGGKKEKPAGEAAGEGERGKRGEGGEKPRQLVGRQRLTALAVRDD